MLVRAPKPLICDHAVGGDIGTTINLAGIDVNVLGITRIAFNRAFTIAVVKLFDEVLLPEEVSNLRGEVDVCGGHRTAVNCFHTHAVITWRNWYACSCRWESQRPRSAQRTSRHSRD